jgi:hypothetical protein
MAQLPLDPITIAERSRELLEEFHGRAFFAVRGNVALAGAAGKEASVAWAAANAGQPRTTAKLRIAPLIDSAACSDALTGYSLR